MPINSKIVEDDYLLILWKIEEDELYFLNYLKLNNIENQAIEHLHPKRRLDYLASRTLMHKSMGLTESLNLFKDEFGKLQIEPYHLQRYISLSHSGDWTGFVYSEQLIGFDIQVYSEKINNIKERFLDDDELKFIQEVVPVSKELKYLNLFWCIKEAVYKAYGKKQIIFKDQIKIETSLKVQAARLILNDHSEIYYKIDTNFENEYCYAIAVHKS